MRVALTGATGFLGLRLLDELLCRHRSVTVLARGEPERARERIARGLARFATPRPDLPARLRVVSARVTEPRLGLPEDAYRELADSLDAVWHCAGDTTLDGDLAVLRRVNVAGTRHVLDLAGAGSGQPMVFHVSTAFVAGARRAGVVYEDELTDAYGFEGAYERSKYEAELLVHAWARATGRPAVVFRPSVLTTGLPPHPDLPEHPLLNIERTLTGMERSYFGPGGLREHGRFRIVGRPDGQLNLMPVEDAAAVMARLADLPPAGGVETYHVVHGRETPVEEFRRLLERLTGVRVAIVPRLTDPSPREAAVAVVSGVFCYLGQRRRYDDSRVRARLGPPGVPARVDADYLLSGLRPVPRPEGAVR